MKHIKLYEEFRFNKEKDDDYVDELIVRVNNGETTNIDVKQHMVTILFDNGEEARVYSEGPGGRYKKNNRVLMYHPKSGGGGVLSVSRVKAEELRMSAKDTLEDIDIRLIENQDTQGGHNTPAIGDTVYINYKIPGGKGNYEPTPVEIIAIKGQGNSRTYIATHRVELSKFKHAPNLSVKKSDIIGPYKGVDTPVGYGWVAKNPNINTGINQVSNDMAL